MTKQASNARHGAIAKECDSSRHLGLIRLHTSDGHPFLAPTPAVKSTAAACGTRYALLEFTRLLFARTANPRFLAVCSAPSFPRQSAGFPGGDRPVLSVCRQEGNIQSHSFCISPNLKRLESQSSQLEKGRRSSPLTTLRLGRSAGAGRLMKQREQQGGTIHVLSRWLSWNSMCWITWHEELWLERGGVPRNLLGVFVVVVISKSEVDALRRWGSVVCASFLSCRWAWFELPTAVLLG